MLDASSLPKLAEEFIRSGIYLRNWSKGTVRTYTQALQGVSRWLDGRGCEATLPPLASKAGLEALTVSLRTRGVSPSGCNVYLRTINSFLTWLHDEGVIERPLRARLLQHPRNPPPVFSDADVRLLVRDAHRGTRLGTLVACLLDTGVRIDEALKVRIEDCDLDGLAVAVLGKGSRVRRVPISQELRKLLWKHLKARQRSGTPGVYVFATRSGLPLSYRNVHRDLRALCARLGIVGPRVSPHTCRHYFACSYIRNGGDIYRLSRILGHTSVKTTEIYLRSMGLDALAEGHQGMSPLVRLR